MKKRRERFLRWVAKGLAESVKANGGTVGTHSAELLGGSSADLKVVQQELERRVPEAHVTRFGFNGQRVTVFVRAIKGRKLREVPPDGPDSHTPRFGKTYN